MRVNGILSNTAHAYLNSIQAVSITLTNASSNTATITAVSANAFIIYDGFINNDSNSNGTNYIKIFPRVTLTNSTTVTVNISNNNANTVTVKCFVIDPTPSLVQSVQFGTITLTSVTSNTATITSVDTARSAVFYLGNTSAENGSGSINDVYVGVTLTNGTTVTANQDTSVATSNVVSFCVVQFATGVLASLQQFSLNSSSGNAAETQTITSVNTSNSFLAYGGQMFHSSTGSSAQLRVDLTNSTTLTFTRVATTAATRTVYVTVLEFISGVFKSIQRGTSTIGSAATTHSETISAITVAKTFVNFLGWTNSANISHQNGYTYLTLDSTTALSSTRNTSGTNTVITGWEAVEFN